MESHSQPKSKRPTCPSCSKPLSLCFCTRLKTPNLDNKVHITILQHSLEKKHPLNSARIAKLGLRNVDVFTVSDVLFDAQIVIRSLGSDDVLGLLGGECTLGVCGNASESFGSGEFVGVKKSEKWDFCQANELGPGAWSIPSSVSKQFADDISKRIDSGEDSEALLEQGDNEDMVLESGFDDKFTGSCDDLMRKDSKKCNVEPVITLTVGKYGEITSVYHPWKLQDDGKIPKFEQLIASPEAVRSLGRGFVVKKLQNQQKEGSVKLQQFEEFEIKVPPGSVLLFPAQKSVPVEAIDFEVKNLIVLDGTWAKTKRMYKENPWLRVLPCVKLNVEKMSLFSEVRRQPKPGCLSTIESIVYALKALGERDNLEELDNLLDVLESMVEDQRRCKDERIMKLHSI